MLMKISLSTINTLSFVKGHSCLILGEVYYGRYCKISNTYYKLHAKKTKTNRADPDQTSSEEPLGAQMNQTQKNHIIEAPEDKFSLTPPPPPPPKKKKIIITLALFTLASCTLL